MAKKERKIKKFFSEFKHFINKGNIFDLAIAVIIGTAFNKIISSFVNDIVMPLFSLLLGKISFADLKIIITPATESVSEVAFNYGIFIQSIIDFLIIALCIFIAFKLMNRAQKKWEALAIKKGVKKDNLSEEKQTSVAPIVNEPTQTDLLLMEIRDELKKQNTAKQKNRNNDKVEKL